MQLNQRTFLYLQLHLVCWHSKMNTFNKNTICESLVKIQYFRHCRLCMKILKKRNKIKKCCITSCLKYSIFTKHSQIMCLFNTHNLVHRNSRWACRLWKVIWFKHICLEIFKYYYILETLHIQTFTNCVMEDV